MTFTWTAHRFSGGALALDVANSVILRHLPARRKDRFADPAALAAFNAAAVRHCAEADVATALAAGTTGPVTQLVDLREAIDRCFRARVLGSDDPLLMADLLEAISRALRLPADQPSLVTATARSALRLVADAGDGRMKICGHCGWLFLDRSKNRSRAWCDMRVCGNRAKASRHYAATKARKAEQGAAEQ